MPRFVILGLIAAVIAASVTATTPQITGSPFTTASNAGLQQSLTSNSSAMTSRHRQTLTATPSSHQQPIIEALTASSPTSELPTMAPQLPSASLLYESPDTTVSPDTASLATPSFQESPATETLAIGSNETQSPSLITSSSPSNESLVTVSPATDKSQETVRKSFESPASRSFFANAPECEHPNGVVLRPSALWQFVDVSVTTANASCLVTIESLRGNVSGGGRRNASSGVTLDGTSHSTAAKANRSMSKSHSSWMPQSLLILRLVSWHPGSECTMGTCRRPRTAQERQQQSTSTSSKNGETRCAVTLSFTSSPAAGGEQHHGGDSASQSTTSTMLFGDGVSADTVTTTSWTDASLHATVNVSGCCGIRLLLGYKIARARNACAVRSQPPTPSTLTPGASSASSYSSSSPIYSSVSSESASVVPSSRSQHPSVLSSSQPSLPPPSLTSSSAGSDSLHRSSRVPFTAGSSASTTGSPTHLAFDGEFLKKYTYLFAQDHRLTRMTENGGSDEDEAAAACSDTLEYELQLNPIPAAKAEAHLDVSVDLLAAPGNQSCWLLCIDSNCSPPLGTFIASGGRALSVRYQRRSPAAGAAKGSDVACDMNEYSGFTLRLLAPSNVTLTTAASRAGWQSSDESSLLATTTGAAAAGALSLCTAAATVLGLLAARRRRVRRQLRRQSSAEQRKQRHQRRKLPRQPIDNQEMVVYSEPVDFEALELRSSTVVEDSENYAEIAMEEHIHPSSRAVGHAYYKLKRAAEAAAAAAAVANLVEPTATVAQEQHSDDEREHVYSELLS